MDAEADAAFSPALRDFARLTDAHADRRLSLPDYLAKLTTHPAYANRFPELTRFVAALATEKVLNAPAAEEERGRLLSRTCAALPKGDLDRLLAAAVAARAGTVSTAAFCRLLKEDARAAGVPLSAYPNFRSYLAYVEQSDALRPEAVLAEAQAAEDAVWTALTESADQRRLVAARRQARLSEKLATLTLTTADWSRYARAAASDPARAPFEDFYAAADRRSAALADRLLSQAAAGGTAVLVAGGFHKDGLCARLRQAGATVVVLTPRLKGTAAADAADYLSVFTAGRTPLSEIFDSPAITLANTLGLKPISETVRSGTDVRGLLPELRLVDAARAGQTVTGTSAPKASPRTAP